MCLVFTFETELAMVSESVGATVDADSSLRVANVGMAIALAWLAVGEVKEARLAFVATPPEGLVHTLALTVHHVAKVVQ